MNYTKILLSFFCFSFIFNNICFSQDTITIGQLNQNHYCSNSTISVPFTTNLSIGTTFKLILLRNGMQVGSSTGAQSPLNLNIANMVYLTNSDQYQVKITSGEISSDLSDFFKIENYFLIQFASDIKYDTFYNLTLCPGTTKKINVVFNNYEITDFSNYTFQWKKDNVIIPDSNQPNIEISQVGTYSVDVSNFCQYSKSFVVTENNDNFTFIMQPQSSVICSGTSKPIYCDYFSETTSYIWEKDGIIVPNANQRIYEASESGFYKVKVIEQNCLKSSQNQKIELVNSSSLEYITIREANNDTTICNNSFKHLKFTNERPPNGLTYQWQKNGINLLGKIEPSLKTNQPGIYSLICSSGECVTRSNEIILIESEKAQKPVIIDKYYQKNCATCPLWVQIGQNLGSSFSFLEGQWIKDGVTLDYVGAYIEVQTNGIYKMEYGQGDCKVQSNEILINTENGLETPLILPMPGFGTPPVICFGGVSSYSNFSVNLSLNTTYNNVTYQWKRNGQDLLGENKPNLTTSISGKYHLTVSNGIKSINSDEINIENTSPFLNLKATENNLKCSNRTVSIYLDKQFIFAQLTNFVWYRNGTVIPNETNDHLYTNKSGIYTVSYNFQNYYGDCNPVLSSQPIEIKAFDVPNLSIPEQLIINVGTSATVTATGCNGAVNWYESEISDLVLATGTSFITPILNTNTNYYASCIGENCNSVLRKNTQIQVCDKPYSISSGDWNDANIWSCGLIPNFGSNITISPNNNVTVPNGIFEIKNIEIRGLLNLSAESVIRLSKGN